MKSQNLERLTLDEMGAVVDQLRALAPAREPWRAECPLCDDTGWQAYECPTESCLRDEAHPAHSFVSPCPCRASNRTYERHHARR